MIPERIAEHLDPQLKMNPTKLALAAAITFTACIDLQGAVLITEVLYNEEGSDPQGEWLEIYNNGLAAVDLTGWSVGDEEAEGALSGTEAMFRFPVGAMIGAGEIQIISMGANQFLGVYGFLPNYEVASGIDNVDVPNLTVNSDWDPDGGIINMSNTNDQALILDSTNTLIDAVGWGNTFAFNPGLDAAAEADGQSYYRINPASDSNTAADWAVTPGGAGSSSPGIVPEPGSAALLFLGVLLLAGRRIRR